MNMAKQEPSDPKFPDSPSTNEDEVVVYNCKEPQSEWGVAAPPNSPPLPGNMRRWQPGMFVEKCKAERALVFTLLNVTAVQIHDADWFPPPGTYLCASMMYIVAKATKEEDRHGMWPHNYDEFGEPRQSQIPVGAGPIVILFEPRGGNVYKAVAAFLLVWKRSFVFAGLERSAQLSDLELAEAKELYEENDKTPFTPITFGQHPAEKQPVEYLRPSVEQGLVIGFRQLPLKKPLKESDDGDEGDNDGLSNGSELRSYTNSEPWGCHEGSWIHSLRNASDNNYYEGDVFVDYQRGVAFNNVYEAMKETEGFQAISTERENYDWPILSRNVFRLEGYPDLVLRHPNEHLPCFIGRPELAKLPLTNVELEQAETDREAAREAAANKTSSDEGREGVDSSVSDSPDSADNQLHQSLKASMETMGPKNADIVQSGRSEASDESTDHLVALPYPLHYKRSRSSPPEDKSPKRVRRQAPHDQTIEQQSHAEDQNNTKGALMGHGHRQVQDNQVAFSRDENRFARSGKPVKDENALGQKAPIPKVPATILNPAESARTPGQTQAQTKTPATKPITIDLTQTSPVSSPKSHNPFTALQLSTQLDSSPGIPPLKTFQQSASMERAQRQLTPMTKPDNSMMINTVTAPIRFARDGQQADEDRIRTIIKLMESKKSSISQCEKEVVLANEFIDRQNVQKTNYCEELKQLEDVLDGLLANQSLVRAFDYVKRSATEVVKSDPKLSAIINRTLDPAGAKLHVLARVPVETSDGLPIKLQHVPLSQGALKTSELDGQGLQMSASQSPTPQSSTMKLRPLI